MRNCHPSKRKQKKTSQEMGSFFFSRRKWFARLGTNSALACEWHTKNSCMTFLEFLTILACSTHLSCSFAQLDYDFFVFSATTATHCYVSFRKSLFLFSVFTAPFEERTLHVVPHSHRLTEFLFLALLVVVYFLETMRYRPFFFFSQFFLENIISRACIRMNETT